jgi:hypothetical protein
MIERFCHYAADYDIFDAAISPPFHYAMPSLFSLSRQ